MSTFVLDCSVTMAWCFEDESDDYADQVLDTLNENSALVPSIWPLEVANVLLMAERRQRLMEADSSRFVELLGSLPIQVAEDATGRVLGPVIPVGREYNLTAYDAAYLDLAMCYGTPLATQDKSLREACKKCGVPLFEGI